MKIKLLSCVAVLCLLAGCVVNPQGSVYPYGVYPLGYHHHYPHHHHHHHHYHCKKVGCHRW